MTPPYRVELTPRARRELDSVPDAEFERLDRAMLGLRDEPGPRGVTKLKGPIHRLRAGRWRIIYAIFRRERLIVIGKVARRSEDTYADLDQRFP